MGSHSSKDGVVSMPEFPRLISLNEASELTSLSRTMINRLRSEGRFPAAVPLGEKRIAFPREEVAAWVLQRIAARTEQRETA
jgi:prophage regulatory protein